MLKEKFQVLANYLIFHVFLVLSGCDVYVNFTVQGKSGGVDFTVPREMIPAGASYPAGQISMLILKAYPGSVDDFSGDMLMLEKYVNRKEFISFKKSILKEEDKLSSSFPGLEKFRLESGFALVASKSGNDSVYLECAEQINPNTKCWYYGTFNGELSYRLAIPLKEVVFLDRHISKIELKIKSIMDDK